MNDESIYVKGCLNARPISIPLSKELFIYFAHKNSRFEFHALSKTMSAEDHSEFNQNDLADVAAFDFEADVLPDRSTRKDNKKGRIQQNQRPGQGGSKLRNSINSGKKERKSQADELRKGALVNRASMSKQRRISQKRQDSFMSATRILERTGYQCYFMGLVIAIPHSLRPQFHLIC